MFPIVFGKTGLGSKPYMGTQFMATYPRDHLPYAAPWPPTSFLITDALIPLADTPRCCHDSILLIGPLDIAALATVSSVPREGLPLVSSSKGRRQSMVAESSGCW